jgi:hypothetical protein
MSLEAVLNQTAAAVTDSVSVKPKKPGKVHVKKLFRQRLEREGRGAEYEALIKAIQAEKGIGYGQAQHMAMHKLGYPGPKEERALADKWASEQQAVAEEKVRHTFEEALSKLPPVADRLTELNWIRSHPAITRVARSVNGQAILVTYADVMETSLGPAPSQAAARELQFWANNNEKFYTSYLKTELKKTAAGVEGESEKNRDPGVAEIERVLQEMAGA